MGVCCSPSPAPPQPAFGIYFWSYAYFKDFFVRRREAEIMAARSAPNNLGLANSPVAPLPRVEATLPELTVCARVCVYCAVSVCCCNGCREMLECMCARASLLVAWLACCRSCSCNPLT